MTDTTFERVRELLDYDPAAGVFVWRVSRRAVRAGNVAGCVDATNGKLRRYIGMDGGRYQASRLAWLYVHGTWPKNHIDHVDGDSLNDRIENLRDVPRIVNMQNQKKAQSHGTSGFLGVTRQRSKWRAQIMIDGKNVYLGSFASPQEAHAAYLDAKRRAHPGCTI